MPNPIADLNSYKLGVDTDVTTKSTINSITPVDVGSIGTILADVLLPYLQSINNQAYFQGTANPNSLTPFGQDLDLYYQQLTSGFSVWRKQNGIWVQKVTMVFNTVQDGIVSGLRTSISGSVVTVTPGSWSISNTIYSKATQTQFTLDPADNTDTRYDLIYANNVNQVLILAGTPGLPVPALPANSIQVDVAVIPSIASGNFPYLQSGGSDSSGTGMLITGVYDSNGEYDASSDGIRAFPSVTIYDQNGLQSPAQYDNANKKIVGGNAGETFTMRTI